jgi:cyclomaltodextrinase / maltogenic alpha-amylase / neopullulanase
VKKLLLMLILVTYIIPAQIVNEIIQPLKMVSDRTDSVLISDLFYAGDYSVRFKPDRNVEFSYSPSSRMLYFTAKKGYEGFGVIRFSLNGENYAIPYQSEIIQEKTFKYKPDGDFTNINLFGSFNSWNREQFKMQDPDNDGTYEITIQLQPGRYEYKFYVDGKEFADPLNSEKVPSGVGDYNSVIVVNPLHTERNHLHLIGKGSDQINFYYDRENQRDTLRVTDIVALMNNTVVDREKISVSGNYIKISFDSTAYSGDNILRIVVDQDGYPTNIQTVFLNADIKNGTRQNITPYDKIIYSIMVDRFYDGDTSNSQPVEHPEILPPANYNGGDLAGILQKINEGYFDSLGVNTLWITPVNDNTNKAYKEYPAPHRYYSGYHGYWPVHHMRVEERFGDIDLFKKLVSSAQDRGMKVLLDYVAHHVHIEHPFWDEHRDWFGKLELPDGRLNLRLWDEHRLTTWFEPYMPSFDYTSSTEALEFMTDNAVWWLQETNIDGFRHDAVKHVPNSFWRRLTEKIKSRIETGGKDIYQIGETFGSYELISSYVNNGQLDAQFNFNLYDNAINVFLNPEGSFEQLDIEMDKTFSIYGVNHLMGNIMDSHDKTRFMGYADGDVKMSDNSTEIGWINPPDVDNPANYKLLKLYMAYMNTVPGLPVIYYGDEFGMTGAGDPDNRRMMRFDDELDSYEAENLKDVSRIINLRAHHTSLRYGDYHVLYNDKNVYVYMRSDLNERIIVALNKDKSQQTVQLTLPPVYNLQSCEDLLSNKKYEVKENSVSLTIDPVNYIFLKAE